MQNANVQNGHTIYCENSNINIDQTSTITNISQKTCDKGIIHLYNGSNLILDGNISNYTGHMSGQAIAASNNCTLNIN